MTGSTPRPWRWRTTPSTTSTRSRCLFEAASELRRVVGEWDAARDSKPADAVEPRLREALRQIADAESGIWGWIARDALDGRQATSHGDGGARGDGATATSASVIVARGRGAPAGR